MEFVVASVFLIQRLESIWKNYKYSPLPILFLLVEHMAVAYSLPAVFVFVFKNKYGCHVCCVVFFAFRFISVVRLLTLKIKSGETEVTFSPHN